MKVEQLYRSSIKQWGLFKVPVGTESFGVLKNNGLHVLDSDGFCVMAVSSGGLLSSSRLDRLDELPNFIGLHWAACQLPSYFVQVVFSPVSPG